MSASSANPHLTLRLLGLPTPRHSLTPHHSPTPPPTATTSTTAHRTSTVSVTPTVTSTTSPPSVRVLDRAPRHRQSSAPREKERPESEREKERHCDIEYLKSSPGLRERGEKRDMHPSCVSKEIDAMRDMHPLPLPISLLQRETNTGTTRTSPPHTSLPRTYTRKPTHRVVNTRTSHHTLNTLAFASKQCGSTRGSSGTSFMSSTN